MPASSSKQCIQIIARCGWNWISPACPAGRDLRSVPVIECCAVHAQIRHLRFELRTSRWRPPDMEHRLLLIRAASLQRCTRYVQQIAVQPGVVLFERPTGITRCGCAIAGIEFRVATGNKTRFVLTATIENARTINRNETACAVGLYRASAVKRHIISV